DKNIKNLIKFCNKFEKRWYKAIFLLIICKDSWKVILLKTDKFLTLNDSFLLSYSLSIQIVIE
ncbi:hypothetical protein EDI35_10995, partial [Listeria monocytogenes]|nr:hypothetical protein [Listeria monocytogenes]